ncbi:Predicted protein [Taphrina deformans PYCC 5710]|uniref:DSBA-like thioredoxin domain-containing protein n=1 Tax=Taphrina deformans (strain PYCC 5710 / ATCC 11124 / CBS 356.35 / IMI 108563 / JCM 9778 / NBRC 8474) TaxID=1097556 RepID=R4XA59_TAPDE|nr:Predicted protein [Taphrina deformans PYCC 5710]|eukprot:CCG82632.1 Predicted protein [Taphrina deformans PYCC 5710]
MAEPYKLKIHFTLDTICPFTYLGRRRLQLAIKLAKDEELPLVFDIDYRPYDIAKKLPRKSGVSKRDFYLEKNGGNIAQLDRMVDAMRQMGHEIGIDFSYGGEISNTLDAHRVIMKVQSQKLGDVEALMDSLYKQYFEQEQPPASTSTLLKACEAAGVRDLDSIRSFIDFDELEDEVKEAIVEQNINNSEGVPCIEFEGYRRDFTLVGAKDPIEYLNTMKQVLKERK